MLPYLISSISGLVGAMVIFWFWNKATKLEGKLALEKKISLSLTADLKEKEQAQIQFIQQCIDEQAQMEAQLAIHRKNEDALRDALAKGGVEGFIELANSQYGPVPQPILPPRK